MDYVIQFVGIIMIVAGAGNTPYRALLPAWVGPETLCGEVKNIPEHTAYIRIRKSDIDSIAAWPEQDDCENQENCKLFKIPVASDLKIDSGFSSGTFVHEHASYCLVPQLAQEMDKPNLALKSDAVAFTIAVLELPGGDLTARQHANESVISSLLVPAPPGAKVQSITITATSRQDSATRKLVVKSGSTVTIVNATTEMAKKSLDAKDPHIHATAPHYLLFNKLLSKDSDICDAPPRDRPCPASVTQATHGPGTVGDFICSNTGCCKPKP